MPKNLPAKTEKNEIAVQISDVTAQVDKAVEKCLPIINAQLSTFEASFIIAESVAALREVFKQPVVQRLVTAMQDTRLGFLTDRSPAAIRRAASNQKAKNLSPYTYEEVAECCIEALLNGYRLTNNEFNIIAGQFYGAKNGKKRQIDDYPGVTNFAYTNTPPSYESETRMMYGKAQQVQYAKIQCFASWEQDKKKASIGYNDGENAEDRLIFKIKVNAGMGDDAVVGKALSKLFGRVLDRISGKITPESSDVVEVTPQEEPAPVDAVSMSDEFSNPWADTKWKGKGSELPTYLWENRKGIKALPEKTQLALCKEFFATSTGESFKEYEDFFSPGVFKKYLGE